MTAYELAPYVGYPCSIRQRCRSCHGAHILQATPVHGKHVGEVLLNGYTFDIEDIEQVWRQAEPPRRKRGIGMWLAHTRVVGRRGRAVSGSWM